MPRPPARPTGGRAGRRFGSAQVAKDGLVARGVAADRLFILAPKLDADGVKEGAPTRVDFALR